MLKQSRPSNQPRASTAQWLITMFQGDPAAATTTTATTTAATTATAAASKWDSASPSRLCYFWCLTSIRWHFDRKSSWQRSQKRISVRETLAILGSELLRSLIVNKTSRVVVQKRNRGQFWLLHLISIHRLLQNINTDIGKIIWYQLIKLYLGPRFKSYLPVIP
jgi:hypothetical protein